MSNFRQGFSGGNIPISERTQFFQASDVPLLQSNIQNELDQVAVNAIRQEEEVIDLKLKNDFSKFKQLGYQSINDTFERNKANPENLQKDLNGVKNNLLQGVPFNLRQQADDWFFQTSLGYISKSKNNERSVLTDELKANSLQSLNQISNATNLNAESLFAPNNTEAIVSLTSQLGDAFDALSVTLPDGTPVFSEVQKLNAVQDLKNNVLVSGINNFFDSLQTIEQKEEFLESFKNNELKMPFVDFQGNAVELNVAEELGSSRDKEIAFMEKSIGVLQNQQKDNAGLEYLESVLKGEASPDPAAKLYSDAANQFYETTFRPTLQQMDPLQQSALMLDYVKTTEVIPKMMLREIKVWNDSSDPEKLITSANFINSAKESFPPLIDKFSDKEYAKALALAEKIDVGEPIDSAVASVNKLFDPISREIFQERTREFNRFIDEKGVDFEKKVQDTLSGFFDKDFTPGSIGEEAALQYRKVWRNNYEITRDISKAEDVAKARIERWYGPTAVNDDRIVYLPPENFYAITNRDSDWMKKQLIEDARVQIEELGFNVDPKTAFIVSDNQSERELNDEGLPKYIVQARNDLGEIVTITDNQGNPLRWFPDRQAELLRIQKENLERRKEFSTLDAVKFMGYYQFVEPGTKRVKRLLDGLFSNAKTVFTQSVIKSKISGPDFIKERIF